MEIACFEAKAIRMSTALCNKVITKLWGQCFRKNIVWTDKTKVEDAIKNVLECVYSAIWNNIMNKTWRQSDGLELLCCIRSFSLAENSENVQWSNCDLQLKLTCVMEQVTNSKQKQQIQLWRVKRKTRFPPQ